MHSVLIIDDHDIVRLGLEVLLQRLPQVRLVGSAGTLREALAAIERLRPDLVISDMGLGDASGLDTVQALARAQGTRGLLIVTMQDEMLYGEQALAAGAGGYMMKDAVQAHLTEAVQTLLAGDTWTSPQLQARMVNRYLRRNHAARRQADPESALSARELQVLELLRTGRTTKEIAGALELSARTVDIHRANLKKKLGLRSGAELIAFASSRR
jgi:DNA-binding NarL/FixJ family response regulator